MPSDCPKRSLNNDSCPVTVRLHKYLAQCGLGSRRACEKLIDSSRVSVNNELINTQGFCLDPETAIVCIDGNVVKPEQHVYIMLNKPPDVVTTCEDTHGRTTFADLLPDLGARVYHVGRLDRMSEGLLLLTNDGEFAHALTHPRHDVEKIYHVWSRRELPRKRQIEMMKGVNCHGETLGAVDISQVRRDRNAYVYRIVLNEGRKRQIRRMFAAYDVGITRLRRIEVGPVKLGKLKLGEWRNLTDREVVQLRDISNLNRTA